MEEREYLMEHIERSWQSYPSNYLIKKKEKKKGTISSPAQLASSLNATINPERNLDPLYSSSPSAKSKIIIQKIKGDLLKTISFLLKNIQEKDFQKIHLKNIEKYIKSVEKAPKAILHDFKLGSMLIHTQFAHLFDSSPCSSPFFSSNIQLNHFTNLPSSRHSISYISGMLPFFLLFSFFCFLLSNSPPNSYFFPFQILHPPLSCLPFSPL